MLRESQNIDGYKVDTSCWDNIIIVNPNTGEEVDDLSVGDDSCISFVYIKDRICFSNPGQSHYDAIWNYFCKIRQISPTRQKIYSVEEQDDICHDIMSRVRCNGRFWRKYNIIQILADEDRIGENTIAHDVCACMGVNRGDCYILDEGSQSWGRYGVLRKINENREVVMPKCIFENVSSKKMNVVIKSFELKKKLNAKLWKDNQLDSRVRLKLLDIADSFFNSLNLWWVKPEDIVINGSLCGYNWSRYSDIDLHIIVDFEKVDERVEFVKDFFDAKKKIWNDTHDELSVYGFPVEIYVQDINEDNASNGIYSLEQNEWIQEPSQDIDVNISELKDAIAKKTYNYAEQIDSLEDKLKKTKDKEKIYRLGEKIKKLHNNIKNYRKDSLQENGEMSVGNLVFKALRRTGYIGKLLDLKSQAFDKYNSIK